MKAFDIEATLTLRAVVRADDEAGADKIAKALAEAFADASDCIEGAAYGQPAVSEFSVAFHHDDGIEIEEAYDLADLDGIAVHA